MVRQISVYAILFAVFVVAKPIEGFGQRTIANDKASASKSAEVQVVDFEFTDADREDRIVKVRVYHDGSGKSQPVILFSHGLGGSSINNPYLGKHWAKNGYVAVFMQHAGSDIDVMKDLPRLKKFQALKSAASYKSAQLRTQDVSFVLDELERRNADTAHDLKGRLDLEHVGLAGHSFGAVTTMTMAGRKPMFGSVIDEPRIDAFLAMSPQPGKGLPPEKAFGHLERPIFCMTGTKDESVIDRSVTAEKRQQVYTALPNGDKFHLVLEDAEHHAFGDYDSPVRRLTRDPAHHPIIQELSLKFWDAYLKEDEQAKNWLQSEQPQSMNGFKSEDVYDWK